LRSRTSRSTTAAGVARWARRVSLTGDERLSELESACRRG
jgi:hypothetical protein